MVKRIIKIMAAILGFSAGFLLFSLISLDLKDNVKVILFITLWVLIILAIIGIIIYYKIKNKDRLFNEVSDDAREHNIKKKLAALGADKSLIDIKANENQIKIMELYKGYNAVLLVKKDKISIYYEPTNDFNNLDNDRKAYIEGLFDEHLSGKHLFKLSSDELYKEYQQFVNKSN